MPRSEDLCEPLVNLCNRGILSEPLCGDQTLIPVFLVSGAQIGQIACRPIEQWAEISSNVLKPAFMEFIPPLLANQVKAEDLATNGIVAAVLPHPHDRSFPGCNMYEI